MFVDRILHCFVNFLSLLLKAAILVIVLGGERSLRLLLRVLLKSVHSVSLKLYLGLLMLLTVRKSICVTIGK